MYGDACVISQQRECILLTLSAITIAVDSPADYVPNIPIGELVVPQPLRNPPPSLDTLAHLGGIVPLGRLCKGVGPLAGGAAVEKETP